MTRTSHLMRSPADDERALTLASQSMSRTAMLRNAGLQFTPMPAHIDEGEVKRAMLAEKATPAEIAETLAELKASKISRQIRGFVIGADQVLECDGALFDKPVDRADAFGRLKLLQGREHSLPTAACVAKDGAVIWRHVSTPRLVMRPLSEKFISLYLDEAGDDVLSTVGAYQLEGLGAHLFSQMDGDFFTILGLPLLAVLDFLRQNKAIET